MNPVLHEANEAARNRLRQEFIDNGVIIVPNEHQKIEIVYSKVRWLLVYTHPAKINFLDLRGCLDTVHIPYDTCCIGDEINKGMMEKLTVHQTRYLSQSYDLNEYSHIVVFQSYGMNLVFPNPRKYKIIYIHCEILYSPSVMECDHLFYCYPEARAQLRTYYPTTLGKMVRYPTKEQRRSPKKYVDSQLLQYATSPEYFDPSANKVKGLHFIGHKTRFGGNMKFTMERHIYDNRDALIEALEEEEVMVHGRLSFPEYCQILSKCDGVICVGGIGCYYYMRIYESAMAGAVPVIYLEDIEAEKYYWDIGLQHGYNCYMWKCLEDLKTIIKNYNQYGNKEAIRANAIVWAFNNHKFENRFNQIIQEMKDHPILDQYHLPEHETIHPLGISADIESTIQPKYQGVNHS